MTTPAEATAHLIDVGLDVLSSSLDGEKAKNPSAQTGTILLQLGDAVSGTVVTQQAEAWYGAPGIVSRPALPQAGKSACQAVVVHRGDRWIVVGFRDTRANQIYANLAPGETALYATTGQAREIAKADGSIRQYTKDSNTDAGNDIFAGVSAKYQGTDGQEHDGGEWRVYGPWGGQWMDPTGWHLRTWMGFKLDVSAISMPSPISQTVATATLGGAHFLKLLAGTAVVVGQSQGAEPAVKALSLQTLLGSFAADLSTFTTATVTFATAVGAYASAIKGIADPSNVATPVILAACGAMEVAATSFASAVSALMATVAQATGATKTTVG